MVPQDFHEFFLASATISGALIGLLFVAVSVAPERLVGSTAPAEPRVIAASAFTAFTNTLFVSLDALIPGANVGAATVAVAVVALVSTLTLGGLLWRHRRAERLSRRWPYLLVGLALLYATQLGYGIRLLVTSHDRSALQTLAGLILGLYAIGTARAWELFGARGQGLVDALRVLAEQRTREGGESAHDGQK